ncbi:hypothetical protein PSEUDO8BK_80333 [Pseudomonas sp. 8BK]|nr:hypothetical protein PSEUDO8BK_80333 [Pseudomonas sp. 8BK]
MRWSSGHLYFDYAIGVDVDLAGAGFDLRRHRRIHHRRTFHSLHTHRHRWLEATGVEAQADQLVTAAAEGFGGQLCAGLEGCHGVLEQGVFVGLAGVRGDAEVHSTHFQGLQHFPGELGQCAEIGAFQAQLSALAPGSNFLALVVVHRVAVAAAGGDADAFDLARLGDAGIQGLADLRGEGGWVAVLGFAVEGDVHQVVGNFLSDLGAQCDLVIARFFGHDRGAQQGGGAQQQGGGEAGQWQHDDSFICWAHGVCAAFQRVDVAIRLNGLNPVPHFYGRLFIAVTLHAIERGSVQFALQLACCGVLPQLAVQRLGYTPAAR